MFFSAIKKIGSLVLSGILLIQPLISPSNAIITNNLGNTINLIPPNCGNHWESSYVINSNEDMAKLSGCQTLNGSLYINGGNNINSLRSLSELRTIFGHLVILDSPLLTTLEGLHNLHHIYAYEKYLDTYSVSIKHNRDDNQLSNGLCYVDTFPWTIITQNQEVEIKNNAINCQKCHNQCLTCWDKYSYNGFRCKNYKSGDHCVEECPKGTKILAEGDFYNNIICNETIPGEPKLEFISKTYNSITFDISIPQPNGVIRNISLFINGEIKQLYSYLNNDVIPTKYTISELQQFTNYQLNIGVENKKGGTISQQPYIIKTYPYNPFKPSIPKPNLDGKNKFISFQFEDDFNTFQLENNIVKTEILAHLIHINSITRQQDSIINTTVFNISDDNFSIDTKLLALEGNYSFQVKVISGFGTWNISDLSETIYFNINDYPESDTYPTSFIIMGVVITLCIILFGLLAYCIKTEIITKKCITDYSYISLFSCATCFNYLGNIIRCKCKKPNNKNLPAEHIYDIPNHPITIVPGSANVGINMTKNVAYTSFEAMDNNLNSYNNPSYGLPINT